MCLGEGPRCCGQPDGKIRNQFVVRVDVDVVLAALIKSDRSVELRGKHQPQIFKKGDCAGGCTRYNSITSSLVVLIPSPTHSLTDSKTSLSTLEPFLYLAIELVLSECPSSSAPGDRSPVPPKRLLPSKPRWKWCRTCSAGIYSETPSTEEAFVDHGAFPCTD